MSDCPYCAEEIPAESEKCPACGEHLGDERELTARGGGPKTALIIIFLAGGLLLALCLVALLVPAYTLGTRVGPTGGATLVTGRPLAPPLPAAPVTDPQAPTTHPLNAKGELDAVGGEAGYRIYAQSGFVFFDVGDLRIAVRGVSADSKLGGVLPIAPDLMSGGGGQASSGQLQFSYQTGSGSTVCILNAGPEFTFASGKLELGAHSLGVMGPKQVITVDPDGQNAVVQPYAGP